MATPLKETLEALLTLQSLDTQIARARRAIQALDTGADAQATAAAAQKEADSCRTALHQAQGELKDSELKLKSVEEKRQTYQNRLYQGTVTNPKELANIEKEIAALGRQRADLDDRILTLMEEVERLQEAFQVADAQSTQAETARQTAAETYQSHFDAQTVALNALMTRRGEEAGLLEDKTLLKRYDDLRAKAGGIGIARIVDASCSGCHTSLPSDSIAAVREGARAQTCENCGRLLAA